MHKDSPYGLYSSAAQAAAVMHCTLLTYRVSFVQALHSILQVSQMYIVTPCHHACLSLYSPRNSATTNVTAVRYSS